MGSPLSILDYRQPVEFRIGDVIVRSWNILSRHILTFLLLVGLTELLPLLVSVYVGKNQIILTFALGLLGFILQSFAQAIVVFAAFQDLRGRPVSAAESLRQGIARVFPVIVTSILVGLFVFVGFLLCVAPGVMALATMAVALPACVVERMGPLESMSRSADLTAGHRWPIAGVGFAWVVISMMVLASIQAAMPRQPELPVQLATWVWNVLSTSYTSVYTAILYHDLRAVREGIGIDEIASVFD
jgi:hypothetical protein